MSLVALIALTDLLFGDVLTLIGQVVRVGVLGGDFFDRVTEFGSIDPEHALVDLVFEHETSIFLVDQFFHSRGSQSLVPKRGIFLAFLSLLQLNLF